MACSILQLNSPLDTFSIDKVPRRSQITRNKTWKLEVIYGIGRGDALEYALALRSAAVYVLGICSIPLLFPCESSEALNWASCPKSPYRLMPTPHGP